MMPLYPVCHFLCKEQNLNPKLVNKIMHCAGYQRLNFQHAEFAVTVSTPLQMSNAKFETKVSEYYFALC